MTSEERGPSGAVAYRQCVNPECLAEEGDRHEADCTPEPGRGLSCCRARWDSVNECWWHRPGCASGTVTKPEASGRGPSCVECGAPIRVEVDLHVCDRCEAGRTPSSTEEAAMSGDCQMAHPPEWAEPPEHFLRCDGENPQTCPACHAASGCKRTSGPVQSCCDYGPPGHTEREHHDASPCYVEDCRLCASGRTPSPEYDAHGPEAWSLGRESYAHLGYMMSIGPISLRHHLVHAHGLDVEGTLWVDHVEMHALSHEIRVRSCALRDIEARHG